MRLVFDCFKLVKGSGKSIGIYNLTKNLVSHLASWCKEEDSPEIIVLGNNYNQNDFEIDGVSQFILIPFNPLNKFRNLWWELFGVKRFVPRYKADRIVFPRGFRPLFFSGKDTIIVHDLIPFYYKENFPGALNRWENLYITHRLKASIKHAQQVITISEYSKADIVKRIPCCEKKVQVIYNGLNSLVPDNKNGQHSIRNDYFIAITSRLPHKNAKGIIQAYQAYYTMNKADNNLAELVIIGIPSVDAFDAPEEIKKHITCYSYIEDDCDLHGLIQNSKAFLFLSLIEGFGFPPLEAMQLRVPVICSNRTSLPEIIGDAGLLVDPEDAEQVAQQMMMVVTDETLRTRLIEAGIDNCGRFSWDSRCELYIGELTK